MARSPGFLKGVFGNRCPQCGEGKVYSGFLRMNETCPQCGYRFERETGYFTGAMFIQYLVLAACALPWIFLGAWLGQNDESALVKCAIAACVQILVLSPFVLRYSRLLWIHSDFAMTSKKQ